MFELCIIRSFAAAHQLRGYQGNCENLHGHNYKVEVRVQTASLDGVGLAVDFKELKKMTDAVLESWDHHLLNEIAPFDQLNPSAENLARELYRRLAASLAGRAVKMASVTMWESDNASATYREEP